MTLHLEYCKTFHYPPQAEKSASAKLARYGLREPLRLKASANNLSALCPYSLQIRHASDHASAVTFGILAFSLLSCKVLPRIERPRIERTAEGLGEHVSDEVGADVATPHAARGQATRYAIVGGHAVVVARLLLRLCLCQDRARFVQ